MPVSIYDSTTLADLDTLVQASRLIKGYVEDINEQLDEINNSILPVFMWRNLRGDWARLWCDSERAMHRWSWIIEKMQIIANTPIQKYGVVHKWPDFSERS